jgi:hypothetical protein
MANPFAALTVAPRTGTESFHADGQSLGFRVTSFWRWAASDLASNVWRGVLAEYLVVRVLGVATGVRTEWDACDIRTQRGTRVEVKSAAYLQSWQQRAFSAIAFDIAMKRGWDAETNTSASVPCRSADVHVFALLAHRDKSSVDPTDLAQWEFYVVSARTLDATFGAQKKVTLRSLRRVASQPVSYSGLRLAVNAAFGVVQPEV